MQSLWTGAAREPLRMQEKMKRQINVSSMPLSRPKPDAVRWPRKGLAGGQWYH